jgi:hypothetical protein
VLYVLANQARQVVVGNHAQGYHQDQRLEEFLGHFADILARTGDRSALVAYAADIRKDDPKNQHLSIMVFEPMWTHPDDPAIREAARWLFNDPASPWSAFVRVPGQWSMNYFFQDSSLYASPLLRSAGFRDAVIASLGIKSRMGTVQRSQPGAVQFKTDDGYAQGFAAAEADLEGVELGADRPFRVCDYVAWHVSSIEGAPRCELYWPEDRRDNAVAACVPYLKTYGDRFTIGAPGDEPDPPHQTRAHLAFPLLDGPATRDDVRGTRAIFSLEGQGEARRASVPSLPIKARWLTLEDRPIDRPGPGGIVLHEFDQDGWIWQAEEVRKGDRWERHYGFVGHHLIARVPASEVEQADRKENAAWGRLTSGLDARIEPEDPSARVRDAENPVIVVIRIRNRRGVENTAPTEFVRRGTDGRALLRRGVSLAVYYAAPKRNRSDMIFDWHQDEVKPKRSDLFVPGPETRSLAPFETMDLIRLDLNDQFDLTKPGTYRIQVMFTADSGVGEGGSNHWLFTVGERQGPARQ